MKTSTILYAMLMFIGILSFSSFNYVYIPDNTDYICEEETVSSVDIQIRNYSDWVIKLREVKANDKIGSWSSELGSSKTKEWSFDNVVAVEEHWKDGLAWKKYGTYQISGGELCLEARGKVLDLKGIKVVTCK